MLLRDCCTGEDAASYRIPLLLTADSRTEVSCTPYAAKLRKPAVSLRVARPVVAVVEAIRLILGIH